MIRYRAVDPRPKLLFAIVIAVLTVLLPSVGALGALGVLVLVLVLAGSEQLVHDWRSTLTVFKYLIPIIFVLNAVFYPSGHVLWGIWVFDIPIRLTVGGLEVSAIIAIRLLVLAGVASWYSLTTDGDEFEAAIVSLGVPWSFAFVMSLTVRLIPEMRNRYTMIEHAQKSRGLVIGGNPLAQARARIPIFIPFFVSIINYGYELAEALAIREFDGRSTRTSIVQLSHSRIDYAWYGFSILTFVVFIGLFW